MINNKEKQYIITDEDKKCQIDSCIKFYICDRIQVKGKSVKCVNYKKIGSK